MDTETAESVRRRFPSTQDVPLPQPLAKVEEEVQAKVRRRPAVRLDRLAGLVAPAVVRQTVIYQTVPPSRASALMYLAVVSHSTVAAPPPKAVMLIVVLATLLVAEEDPYHSVVPLIPAQKGVPSLKKPTFVEGRSLFPTFLLPRSLSQAV